MNVTLLAVGTRGDVQPMLALAIGLRKAGHRARVAALAPFVQMVEEQGIDFVSLGALPSRFTERRGRVPLPTFDGLSGRALFWLAYSSVLGERLESIHAACAQADTIVFGGLAYPAYHVAEALGIRSFWAASAPHTPTRHFPDPFFGHCWYLPTKGKTAHRAAQRLTYHAEEQLRLQAPLHHINRWRRHSLGLPGLSRRRVAAHFRETVCGTLYGCSRQLVPKPDDWPANVHVTGRWSMPPSSWTPPPSLASFLAAGPPPIYIGFGSMTGREPTHLRRVAIEALKQTGQRGILAGPQMCGGRLPPTVCAIEGAPHDWLFRRISLAVHHGGAGTSAAAVDAGVPSVVVPLAFDQHFWAERLEAVGVATAPLRRAHLTARRLAEHIRRGVADRRMHTAARALRANATSEDGVARAVAILTDDREERTRQPTVVAV